jgi:hypothetical protein
VQAGGAAPDQMIGEVIVGGIAHELRGSTSYYPMAVDQPDYVQSNGLPSSARPLHIGRCAGCSSVRVPTRAFGTSFPRSSERGRCSPPPRLRNNSGRQINGDLDRHAQAFLFLQRGCWRAGKEARRRLCVRGQVARIVLILGAR